MIEEICGVCGEGLTLEWESLWGYIEGSKFDVYCCEGCGVSVVAPTDAGTDVYSWIYSAGREVPGYGRYLRLAERLTRSREPKRSLVKADAIYEFVLRELSYLQGSGGSVAEIGSGLGSLTFGLRSAGVNATGFDLSSVAVKDATERFGAFYKCQDALSITQESGTTGYDAIVCTELIEHLEDPVAFLVKCREALKPDGRLLLTTPDKSAFPPGSIWKTELPPIHLWWLTPGTVSVMAERAGFSIRFVDISSWQRPSLINPAAGYPHHPPTFSQRGDLMTPRASIKHRVYELLSDGPLLEPVRRIRNRRLRAAGARPQSICAVLSPTETRENGSL